MTISSEASRRILGPVASFQFYHRGVFDARLSRCGLPPLSRTGARQLAYRVVAHLGPTTLEVLLRAGYAATTGTSNVDVSAKSGLCDTHLAILPTYKYN